MTRTWKTICALLLVVTVLGFSATALAAGTVTYDGTSRKFVFAPGSDTSPTDLFGGFKDLMPGDTVTDTIVIRNEATNGVKVKLYLRALGAQEGSEALLSKLLLTVSQQGESVLFDAPADQTAQLTDWVYLGTFYSGAEIELDVTLEVPVELDDSFQEAAGSLVWEFRAEEYPVEPTDPDIPQTGDPSNLTLWFLLVIASSMGLIILLRSKRENVKE